MEIGRKQPGGRHGEQWDRGLPIPGRRKAFMTRLGTDYAGIVLVMAKSLLLVPMYLRHFGLTTYGAWLATGNVLSLIGLLEGGFTLVLAQRLGEASGRGDRTRFAIQAGGGGAVLAVAAMFIAGVSVLMSPFVPAWVGAPLASRAGLSAAFAFSGLGLALLMLQAVLATAFQAWQLPLGVGLVRLAGQAIEVVAIIVGLSFGGGVEVLGLAFLAGSGCALAMTIPLLVSTWRRMGIPKPIIRMNEAKAFALTAAPVFMSKTGNVLLTNNEQFIIAALAGPDKAAIYGLTDRAFRVGQMIVNQVSAAAYFGLAHLLGAERDSAKVRKVTEEILGIGTGAIAFVFVVAMALNPSFVALWVGPSAFGGVLLSVILGLASILTVRANLFSVTLGGVGGIRESALVQGLELVVRLPLMFVLLRSWGLVGIPIATCITSVFVGLAGNSLALSKRLSRTWRIAPSLAGIGITAVILGSASAGLAAAAIPIATSWSDALALAALVLVVSAASVAALNGAVRRNLAGILGKAWSRAL